MHTELRFKTNKIYQVINWGLFECLMGLSLFTSSSIAASPETLERFSVVGVIHAASIDAAGVVLLHDSVTQKTVALNTGSPLLANVPGKLHSIEKKDVLVETQGSYYILPPYEAPKEVYDLARTDKIEDPLDQVEAREETEHQVWLPITDDASLPMLDSE